jgi:adenylate cyclase
MACRFRPLYRMRAPFCTSEIICSSRARGDKNSRLGDDIERADGLATQALATSPRGPLAHLAKGQVLRAQNRPEEAIPEYEAVIAFNRNSPHAIAALGHCKLWIGLMDEAILLQEQAIRLSPRDPLIGAFYMRIGQAHLLQSRTDEAIPWLEKARNANPRHPHSHAWLASA